MREDKVALLISRSLQGLGGAAMRWRGLWEALRPVTSSVLVEVLCDPLERCRSVCTVTGGPEIRQSDRSYDSRYCVEYSRALLDQLVAAGVTTVICSGMETCRYAVLLAESSRFTIVYDLHNVEADLDQSIRAVAGEEAAGETVHAIESMALIAVDQIWTCSEEDRALLPELHPEISVDKVRVVPNAVPVPDSPPPLARPERVLFTGMLNYYPNMAAAEEVLLRIAPALTAMGSELPVVIAGGYPGKRIVDLSRSQRARLIANPVDMKPLIGGSISIVPLTIGSGSRFKILEAFALGAPVVSTLKGAEGLRATPGEQYRLAESAGEFATEILGLERDENLRSATAGSAWELARDRNSVLAVRRHLQQTVVAGAGD